MFSTNAGDDEPFLALRNSPRLHFGVRIQAMRFASLIVTSLMMLGGACPLLGCSSSEAEQRGMPPPPEAPGLKTSLTFESSGGISLGLREERLLSVVIDPPHHEEVNFVLLGDPLDATLDQAVVVTDSEGRATVTLRGPNQATSFRVRSWIMHGSADELSVEAVGDGFAPVEIIPIYKGTRPITSWKASIVARATCADISPLLPSKLPQAISNDALTTEALIVPDAPVGPSLAVTVRAGEFAWGCTDAHDLVVGETMKVKVNVIDKPIEVGATNVDVTFDLKPDPKAFGTILESTALSMLDTLLPKDIEVGTALLDSIATHVPETMRPAFDDARLAGGWDIATTNHLVNQPKTLRDAYIGWFFGGYVNEPSEFVATLKALPEVPGSATLSPLRFGSIPAASAGMPGTHLASLSVDAGDVMHLGGTLYWLPSRYLGAVMEKAALQAAPEGSTMADVFSTLVACDALGQTLGGFDTCDATCLAGLCQEALSHRWEDALDASAYAGNDGYIDFAAVVATSVDNKAVPTSFHGTWLGSISDGNLVAKISKAELSAELPVISPSP